MEVIGEHSVSRKAGEWGDDGDIGSRVTMILIVGRFHYMFEFLELPWSDIELKPKL